MIAGSVLRVITVATPLTDRAGCNHFGRDLCVKPVGLHRRPEYRQKRTTKNNERNVPCHPAGPLISLAL
jgi:hypothetical protein